MKIKLTYFILIIYSSLYSLTFKELNEYTLNNSIELKVKQFDNLILKKELSILESEKYPVFTLGFNLENTHSLNDNNVSNSVGNNTISNDSLIKSYSYLSMNYNLYSFGRYQSKINVQKNSLLSKNYEHCLIKNEISLELLDNYLYTLLAQNKKKYLEEILKLKNKLYLDNKRLFKSGNISKIDLMKKSLDLADIYSEVIEIKKNYYSYLQKLSNISSYTFSQNEMLTSFSNFTNKEKINFSDTLNAKFINSQIKAKKSEISLVNSEFLPNLDFYSKYDLYGANESSYKDSLRAFESNSYKFGLNFSWNLFNGYKTTTEKEKNILELKQLYAKYELEKKNYEASLIQSEINNKYEEYKNKYKKESLEIAFLSEKYSSRLNKVGEVSSSDKIEFKINKLYKKLELEENKEKMNYEKIKFGLLIGNKKCIVH